MKTEEEKKHIEKKIFDIARQNLQTTGADRPEVKWLQKMCRRLDAFFAEQGKPRMRFMHFKALEL